MRGIVLCTAFALGATSIGSGQKPPPATPQLSCSFLLPGEGDRVPGFAQFSNLKRIPFEATLIGPVETSDELRMASAAGAAPGNPAPTLDIIVVRLSATNTRQRVEPVASVTGVSGEPGIQRLYLTLEIPIDRETRRRNIEQYFTQVEQAAAADPRLARFRPLLQNRTTAVTGFEQMYVESVPGDYEVTCRYSSRRLRYWNGTLQSPVPLRLHIVNDGTFFDQAVFRQ
jgi:hypothetical protein